MSNDKAIEFKKYMSILKPSIMNGMVPEFRFCAECCGGIGAGVRKRLKVAGLQDWRFDFAWPEKKIAVEIDGGQWMFGGGRHNTDEDRLKLNTAALMGWRVIRFSVKTMQDDPVGCIKKIELILQ